MTVFNRLCDRCGTPHIYPHSFVPYPFLMCEEHGFEFLKSGKATTPAIEIHTEEEMEKIRNPESKHSGRFKWWEDLVIHLEYVNEKIDHPAYVKRMLEIHNKDCTCGCQPCGGGCCEGEDDDDS